MGYIGGVDIGGTFTDTVLVDQDRVVIAKAPSTPPDFWKGFFASLTVAAEELGTPIEEVLASTDALVHGTTVATNAMVQRAGASTGLITTRGHGDVILMMRAFGRVAGLAPDELLHMSATNKPAPLIPRHRIHEIDERVDCKGQVVVSLDEAQVEEAANKLRASGVESVAICFLWSFLNTEHERRAAEIVKKTAPGMYVTTSVDLVPKWGEYERTAATAINSYLGPEVGRYIDKIRQVTAEKNLSGPLFIQQCTGGALPAEEASQSPILLLESGPAAGVIASQFLARKMDEPNVIATDMGGTTFDAALVVDGDSVTSTRTVVDQYEFYLPTIEITSIGSGGGSIAWVDPVGDRLRVGPLSAGADPGPACYGRGGEDATVTDADIYLGYLNPDNFLGGQLSVDRELSVKAIDRLAARLPMEPIEVASGIAMIVEHQMADLIRKLTIQKGRDPRDFVLFAYGGAGPLHAASFGRELGVKRTIVPGGEGASVWSAFGCATSDIVHVREKSLILPDPFDQDQLDATFKELEGPLLQQLKSEGIPEKHCTLQRSVDIKYRLQVHVVEVPCEPGAVDEDYIAALSERFETLYARLYGEGSGYRAAGMEVTVVRVKATGHTATPELASKDATPHQAEPASKRDVFWRQSGVVGAFSRTSIFDGRELRPGAMLQGPAIVELPHTTILVYDGQELTVDGFQNLVITN